MSIRESSLLKKINSNLNFKAGMWYTVANFLLKGISFFTIPIFTSLLSVEEYGVVNTFNAWLGIVSCVICLNLNYSIANAKYDYKKEFKEYISTILVFSIVIYIFIVFAVNIFIKKFDDTSIFTINLMLLQSFGMYILNYRNSEHNMNDDYRKYVKLSFISTLLNIVLSVVLMITFFNRERAMGRILGSSIASVVLAAVIIIIILKDYKFNFKIEYVTYALRLSLPMIPYTLSTLVLNQFDRIFVQKYCGDIATGIYSFIYNLGMVLMVLSNSLNNAWKPYIFKMLDKKKYKDISKNANLLLLGYSIISVIFLLISPELQYLLGSNKYAEGIYLMIPLILSSFFIFAYNIIVFIEFYLKKLYLSTIVTIILAIVNIILNNLLIPIYGYSAAGYTTFICYMLMFIWHYVYIKYSIKMNIVKFRIIVLCFLILVISSIVFYLTINSILFRYILILCLLICIFLLYRKLRKKG